MTPPDRPKTPPANDREAKLAQALRANLRRRKAAPRAVDPPPSDDDKRS
ncbi:MAG: hypothetical protein U1E18_04190 [Brevundimonas sp.]|nr:hypothetical protein [Brevundimonas sp.]MDZ4108784.1 hypothetical protein [Brevundimonas sp.]MDZ4319809.1 hypothetical protein [Phenylobacterium sp.]